MSNALSDVKSSFGLAVFPEFPDNVFEGSPGYDEAWGPTGARPMRPKRKKDFHARGSFTPVDEAPEDLHGYGVTSRIIEDPTDRENRILDVDPEDPRGPRETMEEEAAALEAWREAQKPSFIVTELADVPQYGKPAPFSTFSAQDFCSATAGLRTTRGKFYESPKSNRLAWRTCKAVVCVRKHRHPHPELVRCERNSVELKIAA